MIYNELRKRFIDKGLKIFPVAKNGKIPIIEEWQKDCSDNKLQISYWVDNANGCNWGLPCTPNNIFVLDIDVHDVNGFESAKKLFNDIGLKPPIDTLCQKTPSGGLHMIFESDDDLKQISNTSMSFKNYPGIDIRTDGFIVVYPSIINGVQYEFINDKPINKMPEPLKKFIMSQKDIVKNREEKTEYKKPEKVSVGSRDTEVFKYINNLYYHTRLSKDEILILANHFNESVCEKPLPEKTIKYKVNKAFKKDRGMCIFIILGDINEE